MCFRCSFESEPSVLQAWCYRVFLATFSSTNAAWPPCLRQYVSFGGLCHIASWALPVEAEFTCLSFVLNCQPFLFKLSVSIFVLCPWPETAQDNIWSALSANRKPIIRHRNSEIDKSNIWTKTIHTEAQQFEQRYLKLSTREFGTGHRTTRNTNRGSAHCFAAGYSDNIVRPPHPPTKPCDLVPVWKWTGISSTGPIEQSRRALGQRMRKPSFVHECLNKAGCPPNLEQGLF